MINGVTSIALTKLDVLSELPEVKICTRYERTTDGKQLDDLFGRNKREVVILDKRGQMRNLALGAWGYAPADIKKSQIDKLAKEGAAMLPNLGPQETGYWNPAVATDASGKTTLTRVLAGIIPRELRGAFRGAVRGIAPREVGLVFEEFEAQLFTTEVELEVAFGPESHGVPRDEIARRVPGRCELLKLEQCGHSPFRDQPEKTLGAITRFIQSL